MYTHPVVVNAVTKHIVDFYVEANTRFVSDAGDLIDGFLFGNDFGTPLDLLISPDAFRECVFRYSRRLTDLGHYTDTKRFCRMFRRLTFVQWQRPHEKPGDKLLYAAWALRYRR